MHLSKVLIIEHASRQGTGEALCTAINAQKEFPVVARRTSPEDAPSALNLFSPQVVLVDMDSIRRSDGLALGQNIRDQNNQLKIVFMSDRANPSFAKEALLSSISGWSYWLNKPSSSVRNVLVALDDAISGDLPMDAAVLDEFLTEDNFKGILSPRQHQALNLMTQGLSNAAIATECNITTKAAERVIATASDLLGIPAGGDKFNRRVLTVLEYLKVLALK
ncbi:unannotated protein [freshwater metagenome]|jgi:DNA-binding NarL/FixJ family response regulator|uniref:Unannotated protein n=1 Tax=freshwater metagenome TaxID=449393 RepID=A0A6J7N8Z7_9ZZZZ|nr:response regulator [Actinomycetota bacterium]MSX48494.1 response regulator [Actinomycetota bacterium]MSY09434.1 response regulator [Actinomycetota bacterium]MSY55425.1 response regulator [Actinomycetota bacterium]MSZ69371.1 response regulator [Actinomycetota bacterium]